MQIFMLSSGSAHVGLLMLHIDSAVFNHTALCQVAVITIVGSMV